MLIIKIIKTIQPLMGAIKYS